jgi:hypothetical protein
MFGWVWVVGLSWIYRFSFSRVLGAMARLGGIDAVDEVILYVEELILHQYLSMICVV